MSECRSSTICAHVPNAHKYEVLLHLPTFGRKLKAEFWAPLHGHNLNGSFGIHNISNNYSNNITINLFNQQDHHHNGDRPLDDHTYCACSICIHSFWGFGESCTIDIFCLGQWWAHCIACTWFPISIPLTHIVYLLLFLSYLAASKSADSNNLHGIVLSPYLQSGG